MDDNEKPPFILPHYMSDASEGPDWERVGLDAGGVDRGCLMDAQTAVTPTSRRELVIEPEYRYGPEGVDWSKHKVPSRPYSNTRSLVRER